MSIGLELMLDLSKDRGAGTSATSWAVKEARSQLDKHVLKIILSL